MTWCHWCVCCNWDKCEHAPHSDRLMRWTVDTSRQNACDHHVWVHDCAASRQIVCNHGAKFSQDIHLHVAQSSKIFHNVVQSWYATQIFKILLEVSRKYQKMQTDADGQRSRREQERSMSRLAHTCPTMQCILLALPVRWSPFCPPWWLSDQYQ